MTIHNIAFQGWFPAGVFGGLELPPQAFALDGVEYLRRRRLPEGRARQRQRDHHRQPDLRRGDHHRRLTAWGSRG